MSNHIEFPELSAKAKMAVETAYNAALSPDSLENDRRRFAAFLREAIKQATVQDCIVVVSDLEAIAANLHAPPPPPPTLAQAQKADLRTPEGQATFPLYWRY